MKKIKITQREIWDASRPSIHKSKKKYNRKKAKYEHRRLSNDTY